MSSQDIALVEQHVGAHPARLSGLGTVESMAIAMGAPAEAVAEGVVFAQVHEFSSPPHQWALTAGMEWSDDANTIVPRWAEWMDFGGVVDRVGAIEKAWARLLSQQAR